MKFSFNWLKRHLETSLSAQAIADGLTDIGLEVESCINKYDYLNNFIVAVVQAVEKHPNADTLHVCKVFDGHKVYNVVCGASNVKENMRAILALPGVIIPDTGIKLSKGKIRGIESEGMLCSNRELKLGTDHDGIIEIDDAAEIGTSPAGALGLDETIFDISLTPNRGDCFGVRGIARDAHAKKLGTIKKSNYKFKQPTIVNSIDIDFKSENIKKICPVIATVLIKGVKNCKSPAWLKNLLNSAEINDISAVVDVTNFINRDICRPLHAYDVKHLGNSMQIRFARSEEKFVDLKGKEHILSEDVVVSCKKDSTDASCILGIMGGENGCVGMETTDVLLEAALFDPTYVATVGQKLNIVTDSRIRFERGIDPSITIEALQLAASMIIDICGSGEVSDVKILGDIPSENTMISFSCEFFKKISGIDLDEVTVREILQNLGFGVDADFNVTIPSYRQDIRIKEDLVEEILRIYGYEKLKDVPLPYKTPLCAEPVYVANKKVNLLRRKICCRFLDEAINYSFISPKSAELFGDIKNYLEIKNPISSEMVYMRGSLLPGLVLSYQRIINKSDSINGLFEVGNVFANIGDESLELSGVRGKVFIEKTWETNLKLTDSYSVKADLFCLLDAFGVSEDKINITREGLPKYYHKGHSGAVYLGPKLLGYFGELHPFIVDELGIKERLFIFECKLGNLFSINVKERNFIEKKYHDIYRDFAFIADEVSEVSVFIKAIKKSHPCIADVKLFDIYKETKIGASKHSLAVKVTITQKDKIMNDAEIQLVSDLIVQSIIKLGGEIRK